jgi:hypothetical protein
MLKSHYQAKKMANNLLRTNMSAWVAILLAASAVCA